MGVHEPPEEVLRPFLINKKQANKNKRAQRWSKVLCAGERLSVLQRRAGESPVSQRVVLG